MLPLLHVDVATHQIIVNDTHTPASKEEDPPFRLRLPWDDLCWGGTFHLHIRLVNERTSKLAS